MTTEEIKATYSMKDIVARYGIKITRAGFICCPFHGEKTPSLKLYDKKYYCIGCGASGDIFNFVQQMEHIDFKQAFISLGGTYEKSETSDLERKLAVYKAQKERERREEEQEKLKKKKELNSQLIDIYRDGLKKYKPLSDAWCETYNALQKQLYLYDYLREQEEAERCKT